MASPDSQNPEDLAVSGGATSHQAPERTTGWWLRRLVLGGAGAGVVFLLAIQLVPYGRNHTNPAVIGEPTWDSPQTAALGRLAQCLPRSCPRRSTRYSIRART